MRLLVFGQTGQVARELAHIAPRARFLSRDDADLRDPEACGQVIQQSGADAVINAAAYTAVDRAETDAKTAFLVNGAAPAAMAQAAAAEAIAFIHISTDYVFSGRGAKAWSPDDPVAPLGVYGQSKLAGEDGVRAAGGTYVILRTSWVVSPYGSNFVKSMLRLSENRSSLRVVADQVGAPTPAAAIAGAAVSIASRLVSGSGPCGTYHLAGTPDVSWAEFARVIMSEAGRNVRIEEISGEDYPTPASRPANSRLDCTSLERDFEIARPDWRKGLRAILSDLKELKT